MACDWLSEVRSVGDGTGKGPGVGSSDGTGVASTGPHSSIENEGEAQFEGTMGITAGAQ